MPIKNKIYGGMYGVAVGDALGGPVEFMKQKEIEQKYKGKIKDFEGGGWLDLQPGEITDDTQMTIAVCSGILDVLEEYNDIGSIPLSIKEKIIERIGSYFITWYKSNPKDIGNTCISSIEKFIKMNGKTASDWFIASHEIYANSIVRLGEGNGALMRTLPPALIFPKFQDVLDMTKKQAIITHYAKNSTYACIKYNSIIFDFMNNNKRPKNAIIKEQLEDSPYGGILINDIEHYNPNTGLATDSFALAVHSLYTTDTFEDAVIKAVNLGGDADTIGAIAGGLAGVYYEYDAIPDRWKNRILVKDQLDNLCLRSYNTRMKLIEKEKQGIDFSI